MISFNSICKTIGFSFYGFTLINSIIFYSCLYIGLKRHINNFNFLILVFMYKMFFYDTFISMRQSISIAIFFVALNYIKDKKLVKYIICCVIATLFHNSSIILFPNYLINYLKIDKKKLRIITVIFIIFLILNITGIFVFNPYNILNKIPDNKMDKVGCLNTVLTFIKISAKGIYKERSSEKTEAERMRESFLFLRQSGINCRAVI